MLSAISCKRRHHPLLCSQHAQYHHDQGWHQLACMPMYAHECMQMPLTCYDPRCPSKQNMLYTHLHLTMTALCWVCNTLAIHNIHTQH